MHGFKIGACCVLVLLLVGCAGHGVVPVPASLPAAGGTTVEPGAPQSAWPTALPVDAVQPWEQLDEAGHVLPSGNTAAARDASGINTDSRFVPGVERYIDSGAGVSDNGEACTITSGAMGESGRGWASYRLILGGVQPGVISADVNLLAGRGYFLGLADYGRDRWQWFGPFSDSHVRVSTALAASASSSYLSPLGNVFISVVVFDGDSVDVVGVAANPVDGADTTAPDAPATPSLTAVDGGLLIEWLPVSAGDLAGYRIHYNSQWFYDDDGTGVKVSKTLEGLTNYLLSAKDTTYIRLSAVDISGNESALSELVSAAPLSDPAPTSHFTVSAPSGGLNDAITVSASGGDAFDFDVDGDGLYDITASSTNTAEVDTSALGIIRPHVRAYAGGVMTAQGGVSLIITGNSRPAASITADPQSGAAPLLVAFAVEAQDAEDADEELAFMWDFDGNGEYDAGMYAPEPIDHEYDTEGTYNARCRVTDTEGAWAVDTVTITITPDILNNNPPVASLAAYWDDDTVPMEVYFDASASSDSDGNIVRYDWDLDGNGSYEIYGGGAALYWTYYTYGSYDVAVRITDDDGAQDIAAEVIRAHSWDISTVDSTLNVGTYSSLCVVNGNPAISYQDDSNGTLKYVRASNAEGSAWGILQAIASDSFGSSLAVINNNPAIAYTDVSTGNLKFIRANDTSGNSWGNPVTIGVQAEDEYFMLADVNGRPAISYKDNSAKTLNYVRAADPDGGAWGAPVYVDITSGTGAGNCLAVVQNRPAICYVDSAAEKLKYVRATDATGGAWGGPVTVHDGGPLGTTVCLAIANGNPAVSYHSDTSLLYNRAGNAYGGIWGTDVTIAETPYSEHSLAIVNDHPAVCYRQTFESDGLYGVLMYSWADSSVGNAFSNPGIVGKTSETAAYLSLAEAGRQPAISFCDLDSSNLMFAMGGFSNGEGTSSAPWPMYGRNRGHSHRSPYVGAQTNHVKWSYETTEGEYVVSSPSIAEDGTVYVGSMDNDLYAINPDGSLKWTYTTAGFIHSSPAIANDGTVYVGCSSDPFYAINPDGSLKWSYDSGDEINGSPTIGIDGTVYVGGAAYLHAINPNGSLKWEYLIGEEVYGAPAIAPDNTVYVSSNDTSFHAFNPDGSLKWSYAGAGGVSCPAIGADGTVYVGSSDHNLYAFNPDGSLKWSYATGAEVWSSPAIGSDRTIYVGSGDDNLYAVKPDGSLKWSYTLDGPVGYCSPAIGADGTVYIGCISGMFYAFTPGGSIKWSYAISAESIDSSPAIGADGTVYVGNRNGKLYAFGS